MVIIDSAPHTLSLVHATNLTHGHSASGLEPTRLGMHFNNSRPIIARFPPHFQRSLLFLSSELRYDGYALPARPWDALALRVCRTSNRAQLF